MDIKQLLTDINSVTSTDRTIDQEWLLEHIGELEAAQGKMFELMMETRLKKLMLEFGERDTDIYVVTFPKSGTTLMQMVLYQMTTDGNMDFDHLYDVSPWMRFSAITRRKMSSTETHRIIKTHDEYEALKDIKKGRFVFVIRDCLDVISSFHEHIKDYSDREVNFQDLQQRKMKHWFEYNATWLRNEQNLPIHYVHYEDLLTNKRTEIEKLAAFLDMELTEDIIERTLDRSSFDFMKQQERKFGEQPENWKVFNNFIRQGKAGEGRRKFTDKQVQYYQALLTEYNSNEHLNRYLAS